MNGARGIGKGIVEERHWLSAPWNEMLCMYYDVLYAPQRHRAICTFCDVFHEHRHACVHRVGHAHDNVHKHLHAQEEGRQWGIKQCVGQSFLQQ